MSVYRLICFVLVAVVALSLGAVPARAQDDQGVIRGWVFIEGGDRDGVPDAVVTAEPPAYQADGITEETLAITVEADVSDNGRFNLNWLRSGIWNVTASAEGFSDVRLRIEVTQGTARESYACTETQVQKCQDPVEFHLARLKTEANVTVDAALGDAEDTEREEARLQLTAADDAYNAGDYWTAISSYDQLLESWPQMAMLHEDRGDAYRSLGQFAEALAAYELFLATEPEADVVEAVERKMVRARLLAGDLDAAGDLASAGGDASREDLYNLGEVAFQQGNIDDAAGWYEKSAAADPTWEAPVFKLGMVALNRGDMEGAKVFFRTVVELAPDSPEGVQAAATLSALP